MTAGPPEHIEGDGFVLRRWLPTDVDAVFAVVSASLDHLVPWMPWAAGYSIESAREFVEVVAAGWDSGEEMSYAIIVDDEIAGAVGLHRRVGPGGIELGYWLRPECTGRGLATRASAATVDVAFGLPDVDRVEIHHDGANTPSAGVPERLGFTEVSRGPREPFAPGHTGTGVVWRLTRAEWVAAARPTRTTR